MAPTPAATIRERYSASNLSKTAPLKRAAPAKAPTPRAAQQQEETLGAPSAIDDLEAVVFLDVDGVLHPTTIKNERMQFNPACMELLRVLLEKTGAAIVLSTTWRLHKEGRAALAAKLEEHGLPKFVSRTPSIAQFQRPREILAWCEKHRPKTWVALDDWPLHEDPKMPAGHFVHVRTKYGLQPDTAAKCLELFQAQQQRS